MTQQLIHRRTDIANCRIRGHHTYSFGVWGVISGSAIGDRTGFEVVRRTKTIKTVESVRRLDGLKVLFWSA